MLTSFFIHRPVMASVISIVIVILGAVSIFRLPVEQFPELAPPVVRVEATYPGADAKTIAETVASPIEEQVNGVDRMIYMSSTSSPGSYGLDVSFETGANVDLAAVLVQNRVNTALAKLPEAVRRLGVTTAKQSTSFVGVYSVNSPNKTYDDLYLSNYMTINLRDEFARLPGVGAVRIIPAKEYGMRIWLDPQKLKARTLSVEDVNNAISAQNVQVAAGVIGQPPAPAGTDFSLTVNAKGRLITKEEFEAIIVKNDNGRVVQLKDVGRVELGSRDYSTLAAFNGKPAAILVIYQLPGANLVDTADACAKKAAELEKNYPPDLTGQFFYDASMFIKASVYEVIKTLLEAFVLVFIVVFVFLQNFRATLIPTLTIPVAIIGTFAFMVVLGFSVNMLTMFGLVLAIGIVVDDAIVVVENVERNLALGITEPKVATEKAMGEIVGPVIAITLVLMSVFIPTAALPGITGQMYRQFALTIAASTFLSAVNALTLSPALCGVLLRPHKHHANPGIIRRVVATPARVFNATFEALTNLYGKITRLGVLAFPATLAVFAALLVLTYFAYIRLPGGFVPNEDLGFVVVAAQLPDSASLERSQEVITEVREKLTKVDGVANVVSLAGFSVLDGNGSSYANAWIVLEPWDVRVEKKRSIPDIIADIQRSVSQDQRANFLVFSLPPINGLGNTSGFDLRVLAIDAARVDRAALEQATNELIGAAMSQSPPKLIAAFTSFRAATPQLFVDIDREKAIKKDVPLTSVFATLQTALGSTYVNDFNLFGRTFQVNTQADAPYRLKADDAMKLEVRTRDGRMVPIGTLATVRDDLGPDRVVRYNQYTAATVNGIPLPGVSSGDAIKLMESLAATTLPQGASYQWSGLSYQENKTAGQGIAIFGLAILLVYLILAAQYESWTTPISVILSVPLVVIGAALALNFRGLDNNVFTQVGLVLLVGLGAKNAILIVEFARQARFEGKPLTECAVQAAKTRFRPILMTSFAFVLGVLPLVIATGAGASSRQALGTAVFGGMIGVTILGLLFTPTLWVVVQWTSERLGLAGKRPGAATPATSPAAPTLGH